MKPRKFKVIVKRVLRDIVYAEAGDIVYEQSVHDYGLASDDTRHTGYPHISVTVNSDGAYPFFTVPVRDLEEIKDC